MKLETSKDILKPEQLITEHIDIWTSAILAKSTSGRGSSKKYELYGITKFRELILELAVRGKLVPQDASDEPASVLIEKIAAEKAQLIKEKVIKKTKPLPLISNNEKAFELPQGWQWVRLNEVLNIFNGNSINARLKESKYSNVTNGLPYIGTKDVGYGFETLNYDNGISIPYEEPKFKVAKAGSVLICAEGGSAGKKCGITDRDICFGNKLYANEVFHKDLKSEFILMSFLSPTFFSQFSDSMTGIIGGISMAKFSHLVIAIPPKEEQQRIIIKVDKLMLLCDQLEQQTEASIEAHATLVEVLLATLTDSADAHELAENWARISEHFDSLFTTEQSIKSLEKTVLQLAVMGKLVPQNSEDEPASMLLEKIAEEKEQSVKEKEFRKDKLLSTIYDEEKSFQIPQGWEWCRIDDCVACNREISYGVIKLGAEPKIGGVPTLRCSDVKPGYIDLSGVRKVSPEIEESYIRTRLQGGEVLINIRGTLGGVATVSEHLKGYNIAREVAMIPVHESLSASYLVNTISSKFFWDKIEANIKGIAYKGLNLSSLRSFVIPIPPLAEQHRIVTKVDELMAICDQLKEKLQQSQETQVQLTDALVDRALG